MVKLGIDNLLENTNLVKNKRVGLITNQTGLTSDLISTIDVLYRDDNVNLVSLFACEHGIRGSAPAGAHIDNTIDEKTNLPVYSLYNKQKTVSQELINNLDTIVFDIQDVGVRFYTYLATLKNVMEACSENNKELIVLDRPNPIGCRVDGNILDMKFKSFVGPTALPICIGMTIGEYALYLKGEYYKDVDLKVVKMEGYRREIWFDQLGLPWIPPSPNMPNPNTAIVYPITCFFEGTNLSEGRGTTKPFEYIGAPWLKVEETIKHLEEKELVGVSFISTYFTPTFSKHEKKLCKGIYVIVTDREKVKMTKTAYELIHSVYQINRDNFKWLEPFKQGMHPFIDLLWGTDEVRKSIEKDMPFEKLQDKWNKGLEEWKEISSRYYLY
jgi:uncharacterized protein YbbC (DUF1343 family)